MGICSSCGKGTLEPRLASKPFLVLKETVTKAEIASDTVFVQEAKNKYNHEEHTTSYYFNRELGAVGLQLAVLNQACFYMHEPHVSRKSDADKIVSQGCIDYSIQQVVKLAQGKKVILMMGAETIRTFIGLPASDVYGLVCKSDLLPDVPVIVPCPNSDKLMMMPIGETRNALRVFAEQVRAYQQYSTILGG